MQDLLYTHLTGKEVFFSNSPMPPPLQNPFLKEKNFYPFRIGLLTHPPLSLLYYLTTLLVVGVEIFLYATQWLYVFQYQNDAKRC